MQETNWQRVLITGCGGMLGDAVYPVFKSQYREVLATDKNVNEAWLAKLDVRDDVEVSRIFHDYRPDLVLHLAAETELEFCETHSDIAWETNSRATLTVARLAQEYGSTLCYISTAGVFDGLKKGFYTEADQPKPIMVYGQTKYEGELHTLNNCHKSFVVRAGWMMGGGRKKEKKFIFKMLKQIEEGRRQLYAVQDRWGTPTYTYDFARNLLHLIRSRQYGLYHMVCEGKGTRFDVAQEILRICHRPDIILTPVNSEFFESEYFAPRPPSEMMLNTNLRKIGLNFMRHWKATLQEYLENFFPEWIWENPKKVLVL